MANSQPIKLAYNTYEPVGGVDVKLAPIIFIHGFTACKEYWTDIPQVVANHTKRMAYAIDARNHGDSEWSDYFNFDVNANDLIHMMETVGIDKAILVGHSMGGITATRAAINWPDRVEKIVVEDMFMRKVPKEIVNMLMMFLSLGQKAMEAVPSDLDEDGTKKFIMSFYKGNLDKMLSLEMKQLAGNSENIEENYRFIKLRQNAEGRWVSKNNNEVFKKALQDPDTLSSDVQGTFEGPACFIYGKLSPMLVGSDEYHIKQYFPNATLVGIEEAGHSVHLEKTLEFTDELLKFIS